MIACSSSSISDKICVMLALCGERVHVQYITSPSIHRNAPFMSRISDAARLCINRMHKSMRYKKYMQSASNEMGGYKIYWMAPRRSPGLGQSRGASKWTRFGVVIHNACLAHLRRLKDVREGKIPEHEAALVCSALSLRCTG